MSRIRDRLYRFRPAGAPGAATAAGVPVDHAADIASELAPLFASLGDVERQCNIIVERALTDAAERAAAAAQQAQAALGAATAATAGERADAMVRLRKLGEGGAARSVADAEMAAAAVRQRMTDSLPGVVDQVIAAVTATISDPRHRDRLPAGAG